MVQAMSGLHPSSQFIQAQLITYTVGIARFLTMLKCLEEPATGKDSAVANTDLARTLRSTMTCVDVLAANHNYCETSDPYICGAQSSACSLTRFFLLRLYHENL